MVRRSGSPTADALPSELRVRAEPRRGLEAVDPIRSGQLPAQNEDVHNVLRTVECEAAVFGCGAVEAHPTEKGGPPDPSCLLAAPGADHLFARIPRERWGVIAPVDPAEAAKQFEMAELSLPGVFLQSTGDIAKDYLAAAEHLGADPNFCLAVEDSPEGIDAALQIGMKVIAVANELTPVELAAADMVIPSLLSLHVVGLHPVLVLEVDALPDYGTFNPGTIKRR